MGQTKKHAKGRLDKYYHLAKDQGYRARSAFKLIQLNKKYHFLENSKVVVDLCAAPGGWLQVCQKYMPKGNVIIGIDLAAIKAIPGCITLVEDITTQSCRSSLKRELKTWKVDVMLHDGAPNVGASWAQDAFTQSELVLSACKLASEFLVPGGTFVSKVFRSKDYNKLMWVFNQLFDKVEATKPTASRNVSAEIFVVCRGYKAPKKIDPRLLDPKYAFKEMDDGVVEEVDPKKIKMQQGAVLNDLMHPEKRKRHRDGYEDGNYTLFKANDVKEFIESMDFLGLLARSSALEFGSDDFSQAVLKSSLTTVDVKENLKDLKLLGKKDFKDLIKWRDGIRVEMGLVKKIEKVEEVEEKIEDEDMETTLEREKAAHELRLKKQKKKQRERKAKTLMKMQLGMDTPMDIGMEMQGDVLAPEMDMGDGSDEEVVKQQEESSEEEGYSSSDDLETHIQRLDEQVDSMYQEYESRKIERNPSAKVKKLKEASKAFEEWYGLEEEKKLKSIKTEYDSSGSSDSSDDDSDSETEEPELSQKAKLFFDNPMFEHVTNEDDMFDDDLEKSLFKSELKMKKSSKSKKDVEVEEDKGFEVVPVSLVASRPEEDSDDDRIDTPQAYTLAQKMLTKSGKRDVIDDAYNRYAFNDPENLPSWFTTDEGRHNKPSLPVTKEAAEIIKNRMRALDARPIKKVAEAKYRKQMRAQRRLEKATKKTEGMVDNDDVSERVKLEQVAKVLGKAKRGVRTEREKVKLVAAKGQHRGVQGRPKGVKGRYKMVDGRMRKETRAAQRSKVGKKKGKR